VSPEASCFLLPVLQHHRGLTKPIFTKRVGGKLGAHVLAALRIRRVNELCTPFLCGLLQV